MNPNDLISVVIPTCRRDARILKRAVMSALARPTRPSN